MSYSNSACVSILELCDSWYCSGNRTTRERRVFSILSQVHVAGKCVPSAWCIVG